MNVRRMLIKNKTLLLYFILTYFDKGLYFILPMAVLYFTKDSSTYNKIEYICSITNILVPFLTFISCYSFYGYKEARDKRRFTQEYLLFSNSATIAIGIGCMVVTNLMSLCGFSSMDGIAIFLSIRTTFYIFVQYINCYYRLVDKPIKSLFYSIVINFISLITIAALSFINDGFVIQGFFLPELLTIVFSIIFIVNTKQDNVNFLTLGAFIVSAIKFSWPIVLNSTAVAFVANYGKVYAYNFLTDYEMYCLSFLLRIVMLVEMAHASLVSFFSKDIYIKGFTKKFIITYSSIMLFTILVVSGLMYIYDYVFAEQYIPLDGTFYLIIFYALLHMIGAVIEIDYGRHNKNTYIFVISVISCAIYVLMIFVFGIRSIYTISIYMVIYMMIYVVLLSVMRRRIK